MVFKSQTSRKVRFFNFLFISATFVFTFCGCSKVTQKNVSHTKGENVNSLRIVSTTPSITETLFELKLGDSVVAVSDYCKRPQEVKDLPTIGSLYSFNIEAIVELEPDFVVVLKENEVLAKTLEKFGIETVSVDHSSLEGVLASFETIGECADRVVAKSGVKRTDGALDRGRRLREEFQTRIESIRLSVSKYPKVRVLISLYRTFGTKRLGEVYIAGQNPYFNEILAIVGAENCAGSIPGAAPTVDEEGILALNPEAIVDLATDGVDYVGAERDARIFARRAEWETLGKDVDAVREGRIYPILDDFATIPGPRSILFIEELVDLLHPDRNIETF